MTVKTSELGARDMRLVGRDRLELAGRVERIGRTGQDLLRMLDRGPAKVKAAKVRLWGDAAAPRNRLEKVAFRLNEKFKAVGVPTRVRFDDGLLLLV